MIALLCCKFLRQNVIYFFISYALYAAYIAGLAAFVHAFNYNNNNYIMTTPLKGLFSVILKFPSLPIKNPNWQTSWLFTKRSEFAPGITEDKFIQ